MGHFMIYLLALLYTKQRYVQLWYRLLLVLMIGQTLPGIQVNIRTSYFSLSATIVSVVT